MELSYFVIWASTGQKQHIGHFTNDEFFGAYDEKLDDVNATCVPYALWCTDDNGAFVLLGHYCNGLPLDPQYFRKYPKLFKNPRKVEQ